jgi:hypothetical protein
MGNYFVQTDDRGKVTGVTGIDLDMAFGKDWNKIDYESAPGDWGDVYAYRGLPKEIDEEFGERVLAVSDTQVRDALAGLLGKGEIEATVARLRAAQEEIRRAKAAGMLRKDWSWNQKGVKQVDKNTMNLFTSKRGTSYENLALGVAVNKDTEEAMEAARQRMRPKISQLPELTQRVYERAFVAEDATSWSATGPLSMVISSALASGRITAAQARQVAVKLIEVAMEQTRLRAELEVKVQESDPGVLSGWLSEFRPKVKAIYDEALPKLLGRNNPSRMGTHRRRGN